jgi:hypothetical protein
MNLPSGLVDKGGSNGGTPWAEDPFVLLSGGVREVTAARDEEAWGSRAQCEVCKQVGYLAVVLDLTHRDPTVFEIHNP